MSNNIFIALVSNKEVAGVVEKLFSDSIDQYDEVYSQMSDKYQNGEYSQAHMVINHVKPITGGYLVRCRINLTSTCQIVSANGNAWGYMNLKFIPSLTGETGMGDPGVYHIDDETIEKMEEIIEAFADIPVKPNGWDITGQSITLPTITFGEGNSAMLLDLTETEGKNGNYYKVDSVDLVNISVEMMGQASVVKSRLLDAKATALILGKKVAEVQSTKKGLFGGGKTQTATTTAKATTTTAKAKPSSGKESF